MSATVSVLEVEETRIPAIENPRLVQFEQEDVSSRSPGSSNVTEALLPVSQKRVLWVLTSAFLTICITIGLNQSYGVFQAAYTSGKSDILPQSETQSRALIAFIGTLGSGLTWAGSIFINPLMARLESYRTITISGVVLMSLGFLLASFASKAWHLVLTQGLLYGIGSSMLYFPILAVAPEYFTTHRGSAMGFILSGAGISAVALSPILQGLIAHFGTRWTLRFLSLLVLVTSLPIAATASPSRFRGARRPTRVNLQLARKPTFLLSVAGGLLLSSGNLIPLTFLSEFSIALGYTAAFGAGLISVNNGVNSVSRIATGFAGDRFGRQNALALTVIGGAVTVCGVWLACVVKASQSLWICFVVLFGIWGGGYSALFPTTIAEVFGLHAYASVNGFIYFIRGCGSLFGSPVAGLILGDKAQIHDYLKVVYFDSALLFGASVCVVGVRYFDAVEKGAFKLKA